MPGYVHVYTGAGKGKTTAALGLALRAAGAGLRVFIAQFLKGRRCSEHKALERFSDLITVRLCGRGEFIRGEPALEDIEAARQGLREARAALASGHYKVVVLDEASEATHLGLFSAEELIEAVGGKAKGVEVVITGRHASPKLLGVADLVTEMREVKHYFARGVKARRGIEE
jgi:cob(I)alamin adenosyltransferase